MATARKGTRRQGSGAVRPQPKSGPNHGWTVAAGGVALLVALGVGWHALSARRGAAIAPSVGNFTRVAQPAVAAGKPVPVFFLSALYCPFCAAERWALVEALGRFGTWSDLGPSHSTSGVDGFASVPTYDFVHAHYQSSLVAFTARDVADAQGKPLEPLLPAEKTAVNRYDPGGGIPFLLIDGAFAQQGSGFSPGLLVGKPFGQVRAALGTRQPEAQAIGHEADVLTALICYADGGQPQAVCQAATVQALEAKVS